MRISFSANEHSKYGTYFLRNVFVKDRPRKVSALKFEFVPLKMQLLAISNGGERGYIGGMGE